MNVSLDFSLSAQYSVVEQTIFRLVMEKVRDVKTITDLLCVYSNDVIANAIKKLVNDQILRANIETRTLSISDPVMAIIEECLKQSQNLDWPDDSNLILQDSMLIITDNNIKRQILHTLLPEVNLGFLVDSIDFVVYQRGIDDEK
ncbi:MAG: hypothetical protein IJI41_09905 [Anaerolineaceae bacterium]|nr:hypothetical protein [Anaerolineaceae bacterium]